MVERIERDLRVVDGRYLVFPPWYQGETGWGNTSAPNVYRENGDAVALYPCGTVYKEGDRKFRYVKYIGTGGSWNTSTVTATDGDDLFGKFLFTGAYQQDMATGLLIRHLAAETSMWYQTTVTAERSTDFFSGGYVNGKDTAPSDARHFMRRIIAHNYSATGSATAQVTETSTADLSSFSQVSELQLDQPIINSKTSMATTIMANPWKKAMWMPDNSGIQYGAALGACMVNDIIANRFCWLQVSGPMAMHHIQNANRGAATNEMIFYIQGDGTCQGIDGTTDTYSDAGNCQVAGRLWSNASLESGSGQDEGLPMIWVELE